MTSCGQNSLTEDKGVIINGVSWATRNVDNPGTFAVVSEDAGMFYQWNRLKAWSATEPGEYIAIGEIGGWDNSISESKEWEKANSPCPTGWRLPTLDEINSLFAENVSNIWTTQNGVQGRLFVDKLTNESMFLPAVGNRRYDDGSLAYVGTKGNYLCSEAGNGNYVCTMSFNTNKASWNCYSGRHSGYSIRCVKE